MCVVRAPHGLSLFDSEGFIEFRNIGERADHAPFRRLICVAQQSASQQFFASLVEPAQCVTQEETLSRGHTGDFLAFLVLISFLERIETEKDSAVIRAVSTE